MAVTLLLDCDFLCRRAFYAAKQEAEAVPFMVLRDVQDWIRQFNADRIGFCWDQRPYLRERICPGYKARRKDVPEAEREARQELYRQQDLLRDRYLPFLGFRNVWRAEGYEADDLIAAAVKEMNLENLFLTTRGQTTVVVSSDQDLFQLLHPDVSLYNPITRVTTTLESFQQDWCLTPEDWSHVKALAGCSTDEVEGLNGIGLITAAAYVRGDLKPTGSKYKTIVALAGQAIWRRNLKVVELPFKGTPRPEWQVDLTTPERWRRFEEKTGLRNLGV